MTSASISAETHSQPRLRGFALVSVITALMLMANRRGFIDLKAKNEPAYGILFKKGWHS